VAGFSLEVKLPRDLWLHLGGYPGWCAVLNHQGEQFLAKRTLLGFNGWSMSFRSRRSRTLN